MALTVDPRMTAARTGAGLFLFALAGLAAAGISHSVQAAPAADLMGALAPRIEARLPQWVAAWKAASPGFELRSLRLASFKAIEEVWAPDSYDPNGPYEELRRKLYATSPDGRRAINAYAAVFFETRTSGIVAGFADDGVVRLIDLTANRTMWLGQCDASCGFHDAMWLANDSAVVARDAIDYDDPSCPSSRMCRSIPQLLMYDFSRRSGLLFQGPAIPAGPRHDYTVNRVRERLPQVSVYY